MRLLESGQAGKVAERSSLILAVGLHAMVADEVITKRIGVRDSERVMDPLWILYVEWKDRVTKIRR